MSDTNWQQRARGATLNVTNTIEGKHSPAGEGEAINKYFAGDGRQLYTYGEGTVQQADAAVQSARAAFDDGRWRTLPLGQRQAVMNKFADLIDQYQEGFALYECLDVGKPVSNALNDVATASGTLRNAASKAGQLLGQCGGSGSMLSFQRRKPVGVVAGIVGWNYPMVLAAQKIAPALITGNSLVLKPSEFTPLSATLLAELALEAGVPPGVFNVVCGAGHTVGATLSTHAQVDLVSFVGSSATGRQMQIAAGQSNMKRLILECGGKSPYLIFDDCPDDLDWLARDIVADTAFVNMGQICVSSSRVLIQDSIKDKLLPRLIEQANALIPSDPLDPETTFGPLMNEAHMEKVLGYIERAEADGARKLCGGGRANPDSAGFYVQPTIFDNVDPESRLAQEEVFGPVMSVFTFKDEAEAIQLANNTTFGLGSYAATTSLGRANRLADGIYAASLIIAGSTAPTGGLADIGFEMQKQSGIGAEGGLDSLAGYTVRTGVHVVG